MTSALVSEALMDATWPRVASASPVEALRFQQACGKEQAELFSFILAINDSLRRDAAEVVVFLHVVISEAFRKSGVKFRKVTPGKIMRTWEVAKETLAPLQEFAPVEAVKHANSTSEPAVFRYLVEAMMEEDDESVPLADDEFWNMLRILKTASDCLRDAQRRR